MAMTNGNPAPVSEALCAISSRRRALALMLGAWRWLPPALAAADNSAPIRLAISESLVTDVNLNDARAAMLIWIRRISQDMNIVVEVNPKVFDPTEEILRRARSGQLDAVALNVVEYRQVADTFDSSQIVAEAGAVGEEQYVMLVKQDSGIQKLGDLRGHRLIMLKAPKMCVAPAWLSNLLEEGHYGPAGQHFGSVITDTKFSRVVLPVFFGQAEACLTSKRGFDTMCALNPQVAKDLRALAISPVMVVTFYVFRKNYQELPRVRFVKAISSLPASPAGRQLATLFQFEELTVRDASCLSIALSVLDRAERARSRRDAGSRKG
jgi:ABC-type phosphate/phosphonate transport system substrate-binding protein